MLCVLGLLAGGCSDKPLPPTEVVRSAKAPSRSASAPGCNPPSATWSGLGSGSKRH